MKNYGGADIYTNSNLGTRWRQVNNNNNDDDNNNNNSSNNIHVPVLN
jgi:hypothetical protein